MATHPPGAEVALEDGAIRVDLGREADRRLALFFTFVLGCRQTEGGWSCPLGPGDPAERVVRIARELQTRGYAVSSSGGAAEAVLDREIKRVRSFERAELAGRRFIGERIATLEQADVLAELESFGWDRAERALLPHQIDGLMHALSVANAANFSVPGAGKTATALAVAASHLAAETIELVLVVGPLSCFRPWEHEASVALPGVLMPRRIRGLNRTGRAEAYGEVGARELLLMSYATAANDRPELEGLLARRKTMLICDESHRVKRFEGGQWAPALVDLARHAEVRMILTGTPMPQGPKDLWSQFNILWPDEEATGSRGSFRARSQRNFDSIKNQVEPFFTRTPKSELKLTDPHFDEPPVEMAPVQAEIYEQIVAQLRAGIPDAASWAEKIERLRKARPIRMIQAASNPDLLNRADGFFEVPALQSSDSTLMERLQNYRTIGELPAKFGWALDHLAGLREDGHKCVVWTTFIRNVDQFSKLVDERLGGPVFSVDGRIPAAETADPELNAPSEDADHTGEELDETREQRIDEFLATEGFAVLVANPAACAESISLHSHCFRAIYLDRTHDCARWLQSIDRIHRLGLPEEVTVEISVPQAKLHGADAIDELVDRSLRSKEARMKALLDDAELRGSGLEEQDTLRTAEGTDADLEEMLRYILGEG